MLPEMGGTDHFWMLLCPLHVLPVISTGTEQLLNAQTALHLNGISLQPLPTTWYLWSSAVSRLPIHCTSISNLRFCYHPSQPTQRTLNKLPPELRCRNFVNKHRLSIQIGAKRAKTRMQCVCITTVHTTLCIPRLVVGLTLRRAPRASFGADQVCTATEFLQFGRRKKSRKKFGDLEEMRWR